MKTIVKVKTIIYLVTEQVAPVSCRNFNTRSTRSCEIPVYIFWCFYAAIQSKTVKHGNFAVQLCIGVVGQFEGRA